MIKDICTVIRERFHTSFFNESAVFPEPLFGPAIGVDLPALTDWLTQGPEAIIFPAIRPALDASTVGLAVKPFALIGLAVRIIAETFHELSVVPQSIVDCSVRQLLRPLPVGFPIEPITRVLRPVG